MKICGHCGEEFLPTDYRQRYCSRLCVTRTKVRKYREKYKGTKNLLRYTIVCLECGESKQTEHKHQIYCSRKCVAKAKRVFKDIPSCLEDPERKIDKNIGYVRIYVPMHPEANSRGYVYEHRVIAEVKIGRRLLPGEIVHHVDGIRWNNEEANLTVMLKEDHDRLPKRGRL